MLGIDTVDGWDAGAKSALLFIEQTYYLFIVFLVCVDHYMSEFTFNAADVHNFFLSLRVFERFKWTKISFMNFFLVYSKQICLYFFIVCVSSPLRLKLV